MTSLRNYTIVTSSYWGFTLTDGALRMLVLLYFHQLGYTPIQLAFLFLLYEFFGMVTNLLGGWIASRMGLKLTLVGGLCLQVGALLMLSFIDPNWELVLSVSYVMAAQALSGIAKDLTKMSSKSAIKFLIPEDQKSALFKWTALLTGSKNTLKGVGFFLGGVLLSCFGFKHSLWVMAGSLCLVMVASFGLPRNMGKAKTKSELRQIFSKNREINVLSAARFFLFGSRDIWFVVAVPVFLSASLGWGFTKVGTFLALWVIGYGMIQSIAPGIVKLWTKGNAPQGGSAVALAFLLTLSTAALLIGLHISDEDAVVILAGLAVFGIVFAINSSVHSYLILDYSKGDKVAADVGFYYMANAGGRLIGTLLSGLSYQSYGISGCLINTMIFALTSAVISMFLPRNGVEASKVSPERRTPIAHS